MKNHGRKSDSNENWDETKSLIPPSPSSTSRSGQSDDKIRSKKSAPKSTRQSENAGISKILIVCLLSSSVAIVSIYIQLTRSIGQNFLSSKGGAHYNGKILIIADNLGAGYLDNVINVMTKFRFQTSHHQYFSDLVENYPIIWSHDYPFSNLKKLDSHQRVNHFPGTGFITNKVGLSTTPRLPNLLPAFRMPVDKDRFLAYSEKNPETLWIQKSSSHRGIGIKSVNEVDLDKENALVQKYMHNPLLIDGKKFDIGIYAVLTSLEPLRVYIYEAESLIRFCAKPYYDKTSGKFNSTDIDSFVVGDDYTPVWLMPSLLRYYIGTNLSMKQTLNSYLRHKGKDGNKIWSQIETVIMNVYKRKEHHLARISRMYQESNGYNSTSVEGSLNQFFEMVRFDFIVDEDLKVFLMEANMSPNLSSQHFPPNKILYEQVLTSYFNLVGLNSFTYANMLRNPNNVPDEHSPPLGLNDIIQEKETSVFEDLCASDECHLQCGKPECLVCYFCLSQSDKLHIKRAIYEHQSKWNFKRLLPSTDDNHLGLQLTHPETNQQSVDSNYIHVHWFRGKCHQDVSWCSQQTVTE